MSTPNIENTPDKNLIIQDSLFGRNVSVITHTLTSTESASFTGGIPSNDINSGTVIVNGGVGISGNLNATNINGNIIGTNLAANAFIYSDSNKKLTSTANPTDGQLLIGRTGNTPQAGVIQSGNSGIAITNAPAAITITNTGVTSVTGTLNQVNTSASAGNITLSLPQSISPNSAPTFLGLTVTNGISAQAGSFTTLTANTPTSPDNSSNVATTAFTALQFVPSAGASNIKPNTTWTAINPNASAATICGGGDPLDMQLVGYGHNRYETPNGPGTSVTYPFTPINNVVSSLNIFSIATDNTILKLTYTSGTPGANQWSGNISGSNVAITLGTSLTGTARAIVEDPNVVVPTAGSVSGSHSYAYILGGYDNALDSISLAMQVAGMHHRIMGSGTNHPTAIGGSFHRHYVGSYNGTFAGTGLEMSGSATNGSVALGGLFTTVTGSTAVALACERSNISGAYGFGQGQNQKVSGTASAALGRNNTISGSDSLIVGNGNSSTGNYSFISGNTNVVSHTHSSVNGGYKAYTSWQGQRVQWAYRDTTNPSSPFRQVSYVDLSQFTSNTSPALLQTLDSVSNISMPAGAVWKCKLNVVARGGNLRGATFDADFSLQTNATPTMTMIDTPIILSVVDAGMGTGANAAAISVGVVSNALNITVQPRGDTPVSTKWFGWLQIIEVT